MTTFQLVCVLLLKIDGIFSSPIRYLSLFKTNCLIDRGVCYEKNISYYSTYKLIIIADKMKNKSKNTTLSEIVQNIIENTTLSEIVQNIIEKYHTVGDSSKYNIKIPHCRK